MDEGKKKPKEPKTPKNGVRSYAVGEDMVKKREPKEKTEKKSE